MLVHLRFLLHVGLLIERQQYVQLVQHFDKVLNVVLLGVLHHPAPQGLDDLLKAVHLKLTSLLDISDDFPIQQVVCQLRSLSRRNPHDLGNGARTLTLGNHVECLALQKGKPSFGAGRAFG